MISGVRRVVSSISRNISRMGKDPKATIVGHMARTEVDNHADTTCFGSNFTLMYITNKVCDVTPFSEEYSAMTDIQIVGACTAWVEPTTGQTFILVFHEGLWFGKDMENSLVNPNQCRVYGVSVCDDPFDPHRKLVFMIQ